MMRRLWTTRLAFTSVFILGVHLVLIAFLRGENIYVAANLLILAVAAFGWYRYETRIVP